MKQQLICATCGNVGQPKRLIKGSGLVELFLWLLLIVPGFIYSLWRSTSRYNACSQCGGTNLIPVDSPVGKKILLNQGKTVEEVLPEKVFVKRTKKETIMLGIVSVIIFFILMILVNSFT